MTRRRILTSLAGGAAIVVSLAVANPAAGAAAAAARAHPAGVMQTTELDPTVGPVLIQPVVVP